MQLALSNVDAASGAEVGVEVHDQDGLLLVDFFDSETTFEIPSLGSRVLRSEGVGAIRRGWIRVRSETGSVRGLLTYRDAETGVEVSVQPVQLGDQFALFVEETSEVGAGLAIFKPGPLARVEFQIRDEEGNDPLQGFFPSGGDFNQAAHTVPEWFDVEGIDRGFLTDFRGLLFLRTEDRSLFAPLGLRFGKASDSLSAVPAVRIPVVGGIGDEDPPSLAPTVTMSASPSSIDWGQSATLTWSSTNAVSANITPGIGAVPVSGSRKVSPTVTTTYRITVRGADGEMQTARASTEVTVISERAALRALYQATGGPDWTQSENWLTGRPVGEWFGVYVDDGGGCVMGLSLPDNNLRGSIPAELGSLTNLRSLSLYGNNLTGPIPAELGSLANLEVLWLGGNDLEGSIPAELGSLTNLRSLDLYGNNLTGSIPAELGSLTNLEVLWLYNNDLTGPIPAELGSLTKLHTLYLSGNNLKGLIPGELGSLTNLASLSLARNNLTGPIPAELGSLTKLSFLRLSHNNLAGPIPGELGGLENLRQMTLSGNARMSGALPASLTNLDRLEALLAGDTGLCAPSEARFLDWLDGVWKQRVAICAAGDPPAAYLIQAVQSRQFPVPLVADEKALLRVFVTAPRATDESLPPVRATFYLEGEETYVADIPGKPVRIPNEVNEGGLSTSANIEIPDWVVQPGLEMVIDVDPEGRLSSTSGVTKRIPESGRLPVAVRAMPVFHLTVIPFRWNQAPDKSVLELAQGMALDPEGHSLLWHTRTLLPVGELDVIAHASVLSSTNNIAELLSETKMIRVMEGASGHYLGMMAGEIVGAAGAAYPYGWSTFSSPESLIIAHGIGHNFGLFHAPCGFLGDSDPFFPETDGSIGVWGYDFRSGGDLVPPTRPDLMSYCRPAWISDYHFSNALRFRLRNEGSAGGAAAAAAMAAPAKAILLWGGVDAGGVPFLEPAFVVDAPAALPRPSGQYEIIGRTGGGQELFLLKFEMPEVADGDGRSSFVFALPVQPGWADRLAGITLSGPGGSVTLNEETDRPMTILRDPRTGEVRGILRGQQAAALTPGSEAAALALEPGLEMLTSRGIPDREDWER